MDLSNLKNKRVLITGNTGFKGSWLSLLLLKQGASVFGISKSVPTTPSLFKLSGIENEIKQTTADLCDPSAIDQIATIKPDVIFHLAAQSITKEGIKNPRYTIENNLSATLSVLEYLRQTQDKCTALFITSDKCYLNQEWFWGYRESDTLGGKEPYGASKAICELAYASYFQTYFKEMPNITSATARVGNVIGGGDFSPFRIIPDCIRSWEKSLPVDIRSKGAVRPWLHVIEPLTGYLLLCNELIGNARFDGESFNFGPSSTAFHTVSDLVTELASHCSFKVPAPAYIDVKNESDHEAGLLKICSDKAENCLNWKPKLNFAESVRLTAQWYNSFLLDPDKIRSVMEQQIEDYRKL